MNDPTRYTFRFRRPSGQHAVSGASPTMAGVKLMVTDMLETVGVSTDEATAFAEMSCSRWLIDMTQRIEHSSGYMFYLGPETHRRRGFN